MYFKKDTLVKRSWDYEGYVRLSLAHLASRAFMGAIVLWSIPATANAGQEIPFIAENGVVAIGGDSEPTVSLDIPLPIGSPDEAGPLLLLENLNEYASEHFPGEEMESGNPTLLLEDGKPVTIEQYTAIVNGARSRGFLSPTSRGVISDPNSVNLMNSPALGAASSPDYCDIVTVNTVYQHDLTTTRPVVDKLKLAGAAAMFLPIIALAFTVKKSRRRRVIDGIIAPDIDVVKRVADNQASAAEMMQVETYRLALEESESQHSDLPTESSAVRKYRSFIGFAAVAAGLVGGWVAGSMADGHKLDYDLDKASKHVAGLTVEIPEACDSSDTAIIHPFGSLVNILEYPDGSTVAIHHDIDEVVVG